MDRLDDWPRWLRAAGLRPFDLSGGAQFENSNLAYQATLTGMGLMISHQPLTDIDLRSGRLVIPFDIKVDDAPDYYVLLPERAARRRELSLFLDWLLREADANAMA